MHKLLVILIVLVTLLSLIQNAPVSRQREKNKNEFKKTGKLRKGLKYFYRLQVNHS